MFTRPTGAMAFRFLGFLYGGQEAVKSDHGDKTKSDMTTSDVKNVPVNLNHSVEESVRKLNDTLLDRGIPGIVVTVASEGELIWRAALGFCDAENQVPCYTDSSMRIGSVSKSIFAATMVAPRIESKDIDLDDSIHKYLTTQEFPIKKWNGQDQNTTIRQLLLHTSGLRSYEDDRDEDRTLKPIGSPESMKIYQSKHQYDRVGFFSRQTYRNVIEALKVFKDDPLVSEPGKYYYTTYGYTVLSAVIEKVINKDRSKAETDKPEQFEDNWMKTLRNKWDMKNTRLDQEEIFLPRRARYYMRTGVNGVLINAPFQDSSYKYAGGGLVSTTDDLAKFGNALIECYNGHGKNLKKETVELLWSNDSNSSRGLGFAIAKDTKKLTVYHTGNSVGSSSVLLIRPESKIVVAILANLGSLNLTPAALAIAEQFENSKTKASSTG